MRCPNCWQLVRTQLQHWDDEHLGDWACREPADEREVRSAIEQDKALYGRGYGQLVDGATLVRIPAAEMLIFDGDVDAKLLPQDLKDKIQALMLSNTSRPIHFMDSVSVGTKVITQEADDVIQEVAKLLEINDATFTGIKEAIKALMAIPHPMYLTCPKCNRRHIDGGEFAMKPHHTHACQNPECGLVWRPMIASTVGVKTLPGFLDPPKRNPLNPGDGPMVIHSTPNNDGSFTTVTTRHHKGCSGTSSCACDPIRTSDRHYPAPPNGVVK